jgi:hypothetical protein
MDTRILIQCGKCGQPFEVTETVIGCPICPVEIEPEEEKGYKSKSKFRSDD